MVVEYEILGKMFGVQGEDWRLHDRIRSRTDAGREIEKFIVGTSSARHVVYFDITAVLGSPDPEPVQEIMDAVMRRQKNRYVTVTLPEGALLMLFKIIEDVGTQFRNNDFDAERVTSEIIQTLAPRELGSGEEIPLTLSVAEWVNVMSIARLIEVPSLRGQEFTNDLIGYIEGALKDIGPGV